MENNPNLNTIRPLPPLDVAHYRRYLPSAYDSSLSIYEQLTHMFEYLNQMGRLTNELISQWNTITKWLYEVVEGQDKKIEDLYEAFEQFKEDVVNMMMVENLKDILNEWIEDGRFDEIINNLSGVCVNAINFGVKADGVTDDTLAVQKALDYARDNKYTCVRFPKGHIVLKDTIIVHDHIMMFGHDGLKTTIEDNACVFYCYAGKEDETKPQFKMGYNSGAKGFCYYYPEQVDRTGTVPIEFGYTFTLHWDKESTPRNIDNVVLSDIYLHNSYKGINLYRGGRFQLDNIHGQPIKQGIYMDHVKDVPRGANIHFWTYNAIPTDNLFKWIKANGTAFTFGNIDGLLASSWFAYGYNIGYEFITTSQGRTWATMVGCEGDVCNRTIHLGGVSRLEFLGGGFTTANIKKPIIYANGNIIGSVKFIGTNFFGGSSIGAYINSNDGYVAFEGVNWDSATTNNILFSRLVVQGSVRVTVNGDNVTSKIVGQSGIGVNLPLGEGDITVDGIRYPKFTKTVDLPNLNMGSWVDGKPDIWTLQNMDADMYSQIPNGIKIKFKPLTGGANRTFLMDYPLPNYVRHEPGMYVLKFTVNTKELETPGLCRFRLKQSRNDGNPVYVDYGSQYCAPYLDEPFDLTFVIPIVRQDDLAVIRFELQSHTSEGGLMEISNMQFRKAESINLTNDQIEFFSSRVVQKYSNRKNWFGVEGQTKIHYAKQPPVAGEYNVGDRVMNTEPAISGNIGWVCVEGGATPVWKTFGTIGS